MTETALPSRLELALSRYFEATEAGQPFDRTEFLTEFTDVADELQEFFNCEQLLCSYAGPTAEEAGYETAMLDTSQLAVSGRTSIAPTLADVSPASAIESLPESFGRYQVEACLGTGAMGAVFRAYDTKLDRRVALKVPRNRLEAGSDLWDRFEREAQAAARLQHPNICAVHDVGEHEGTHFIAMAFVEGESLEQHLKRDGRLPIRTAVEIVRKLASALGTAHTAGIVHRDLKPANVMLDRDGEPVITDFGLAVQFERPETRITQHGTVVGTPAYMAPEQIEGDPEQHGPAVDVYGLGIILYELLTGQVPFRGTITAVVSQALGRPPVPPSKLRADVSPALDAVCLRMLQKSSAKRFQTMEQVAEALADGFESAAAPRRQMLLVGAIGAAVLMAAAFISGLLVELWSDGGDSSPDPPSASTRTPGSTNDRKTTINSAVATGPNEPLAESDKTNSPQLLRRFVGHEAPVWGVAISPDGRLAASCSGYEGGTPKSDGTIRLWNLQTGELVRELDSAGDNLLGIDFSPNGEFLATSGAREPIRLWKVANGQAIREFGRASRDALQLTFLNSSTIATGKNAKHSQIWDVATGQLVGDYPHSHNGHRVALIPNTSRLAVGLSSGDIRIIDLRTGTEQQRLIPADLNAQLSPTVLNLAVSRNGKRLAATYHYPAGTYCWEVESGKLLMHQSNLSGPLCWALNSRHLLQGLDGGWSIFDVDTGQRIAAQQLALRVRGMAVTPDGKEMLLGGGPRWHLRDKDRDFALQKWSLPEATWPSASEPLVIVRDMPNHLFRPQTANVTSPQAAGPATSDKTKPNPTSQEVVQLVDAARTLLRARRYREASEKLSQAIKLEPQHAEAHFLRAECSRPFGLQTEGQHRTTMRYLDKAIRLDAKNAQYLAQRGLYLKDVADQRNDNQLRVRAIADLTAAIEIQDDVYWWWFQRAWLQSGRGELDAADDDYRQAAELLSSKGNLNQKEHQHLAWAYLNNCDNLLRNNDVAAAIEMGDQAIKVAPGMPKAHWNRARAYFQHAEYQTALDALQAALQTTGGNYPDAYGLRATIHDTLGDFTSARADMALALQWGGGPSVARDMAAYSRLLGHYSEALFLLQKVQEATPDDVRAVRLEADCRSNLGDFDGAIQRFNAAVQLDPQDGLLLADRAFLLQYLGRTKESQQDNRRALELLEQEVSSDQGTTALQRRAGLLWQFGRLDEVQADWEEVVRRNPRNVFGLGFLSLLLSAHPDERQRDGQRALKLASQLTELTMQKGSFWLSIRAAAHAETGDFAAARQWQQKALDVCPHREYSEYRKRLRLYEQDQPFRLDGKPSNPAEVFDDVRIPESLDAGTFDALQPFEAKPQTTAEIAPQRSATVLIQSDQGFGTGMILDQQGYVLTCAHVLPYSGKITIHYDEGDVQRTAMAEPVAIDPRHDLALLRFATGDAKLNAVHLAFAEGKPTPVVTGSDAVVIGNPGDGDFVLQKVVLPGSITSSEQKLGEVVPRSYIQLEANIAGGCSGGPLFDDHGRVIGVVAQKARNLGETGFAIPMDRIARFLRLVEEESE